MWPPLVLRPDQHAEQSAVRTADSAQQSGYRERLKNSAEVAEINRMSLQSITEQGKGCTRRPQQGSQTCFSDEILHIRGCVHHHQ